MSQIKRGQGSKPPRQRFPFLLLQVQHAPDAPFHFQLRLFFSLTWRRIARRPKKKYKIKGENGVVLRGENLERFWQRKARITSFSDALESDALREAITQLSTDANEKKRNFTESDELQIGLKNMIPRKTSVSVVQ
ncbi:uncharacterized protein LOC124913827 isoform X2 [Impatiens glandulifera]|uniref:uncharacterized protein LOC124913827 isoform X2 n=1 Tax=Impatiens glandulifera TaxID=253017 RepID=UPI001FB0EBE3|nr:uncharacterized protein LOC124913827 isoform X2 [Impatiens glandulifera]